MQSTARARAARSLTLTLDKWVSGQMKGLRMGDARFVPCLLALIATIGVASCGSSGRGFESEQLDGAAPDSPSAFLFNTEPGTSLYVQFRDGSETFGVLSERDAVKFTLRKSGWNGPEFATYWIDQVEKIEIPKKSRVY